MHTGSEMQVKLAGQTDLAGFRSEARQLLAHQVPPEEVQWELEPARDPFTDQQ
jgi:DNA polymerase